MNEDQKFYYVFMIGGDSVMAETNRDASSFIEDGHVDMVSPMRMTFSPQGLITLPWMMGVDVDVTVSVPMSHIVTYSDPASGMIENYLDVRGRIRALTREWNEKQVNDLKETDVRLH